MGDLVQQTTPIHSSYDGQIIENLDLYVASGDAITVTNDNVIIRNCVIHHQEGSGIFLSGASNVTIENCEVINSSPPTGINPETSDGIININGYNSPNLTVNHVTLRDGSNGIYLDSSPGAQISYVECYNVHGPFPRGEAVQFNHSGNSSLTDFYAYNDPANSYPEDIVSVYYSPNVTIFARPDRWQQLGSVAMRLHSRVIPAVVRSITLMLSVKATRFVRFLG